MLMLIVLLSYKVLVSNSSMFRLMLTVSFNGNLSLNKDNNCNGKSYFFPKFIREGWILTLLKNWFHRLICHDNRHIWWARQLSSSIFLKKGSSLVTTFAYNPLDLSKIFLGPQLIRLFLRTIFNFLHSLPKHKKSKLPK